MKFLLRNFKTLVTSYRSAFILTIIGLTVAFMVFIVTITQVSYDFSFEKGITKHKDLYVLAKFSGGKYSIQYNQQYPQEIKKTYPQVTDFCTMAFFNSEKPLEIVGSSGIYAGTIGQATPSFIDMFTPKILVGNGKEALISEGKALIPESVAKIMFKNENPIGKIIKATHSNKEYTITAVYKDFPEESSIKNFIYTFLKPEPSNNGLSKSYFELVPDSYKDIEEKLNAISEEDAKYFADNPDKERVLHKLIPITRIHLHTEGVGEGSIKTTLTLLLIGILILVVAYINYINISVSIAPARVKSAGIHTILGINKNLLRTSIALEAVIHSAIALLLALIVLFFIKNTAIINIFFANINLFANTKLIILIVIGALVFSFILGHYPARYILSFKENDVIRGSVASSKKGGALRNILILVQFIIAMALIIGVMFINAQNKYMQNYNTGMEKENIVYVPGNGFNADIEIVMSELKANPLILGCATASYIPGSIIEGGIGRRLNGKYFFGKFWQVSDGFLDLFGFKVLSGEGFKSTEEFGKSQVVFNEKFMKTYDLNDSIIGQDFQGLQGEATTIMGVVKDVNYESMHMPIEPVMFCKLLNKSILASYLYIKISKDNIQGSIKHINNTWDKFNKNPLELHFLNKQQDNFYKNETNTAKLIGMFALITIFITCMGTYGLVALNIRYKTKEIALRKINGANEEQIVFWLNKNLLMLLAAAFVIAVPIAYYAITKWLEQFAYKTSMQWWVFLLGGCIMLIITVITVSVQSYRVATTNPVNYLRNE